MDVFLFEDGKDHVGIFRGIGNEGEALVEMIQLFILFFQVRSLF